MNLSIMFDVIIGMVFIYLVFSLLASAINEAIAAIFDSRSRWLAYGIRRLLEPIDAGTINQMSGLMRTFFNVVNSFKAFANKYLSGTFQVEIKPNPATAFFSQPLLSNLGRRPFVAMFTPKGRSPNYIPPDLALPGLLNTASGLASKTYFTLAEIDQVIAKLPPSALKANLEQLRSKGQANFAQFEADFIKWFEGFGEEIGRWYRQKTYYMLLLVGFALAFVSNLDSIAIFRQLSIDPKARDTLVRAAVAEAELSEPTLKPKLDAAIAAQDKYKKMLEKQKGVKNATKACKDATKNDALKSEVCIAAESSVANEVATALKDFEDAKTARSDEVAKLTTVLSDGGIKLGWGEALVPSKMKPSSIKEWLAPIKDQWSAIKFLGLFLSGLALSLGAPIWFDLLKNLVSIRSVGNSLAEEVGKKKKLA